MNFKKFLTPKTDTNTLKNPLTEAEYRQIIQYLAIIFLSGTKINKKNNYLV